MTQSSDTKKLKEKRKTIAIMPMVKIIHKGFYNLKLVFNKVLRFLTNLQI